MQKKNLKKLLSLLLAVVLVAAVALVTVGCSDKPKDDVSSSQQTEVSFKFTVTNSKGEEKEFTIKTTEKTVGAALLAEGLIAGEESQYGLYVKTVNGETLDYDKDGMYWSFYVDGEYAMSGVDSTDIEEGKTYSFKAEKA